MSKVTKVITGPNTVFSYVHVLEPKESQDGTPKYSVSLIIPKEDTITVQNIRKAIQTAYEEGENKLKGNGRTVPPLDKIRTPLRDGDTERPDDPAYHNSYFVNASGRDKPGVVDKYNEVITDPREIYSGAIGRASISFYAYNVNGNRGIGCGLNHLKKLRDGTPLGGHSRAEDDFAGFDDDEEDDFLA